MFTSILNESILGLQPILGLQSRLVGVMALSLLLAWRWRWRDYLLPWKINRWLRRGENIQDVPAPAMDAQEGISAFARPLPRASVVIPCCNQADTLRENLPAFLNQDLSAFEIIIVDEASTDETRALINHLSSEHSNLRYTFVPASSRYLDRRKLAITLGVRAARAPWVVLTEADCQPADVSWLRLMASRFSDESDFVLGYANYVDDGTQMSRSAIFNRLRRQLLRYRAAFGTHRMWSRQFATPVGKAFGGDVSNMAVRKSWFMANKGYADSLNVSCGEDDLLVDALSCKSRTLVEVRPEATIMQRLPSRPLLVAQQTAHREALRRLSWRGRLFRYRESAATWMTWLFLLALMAYLLLRVEVLVETQKYATDDIPYDASVFLLMILDVVLPGWFLRRCTDSLGERRFCWLGLWGRLLAQPFYTLTEKMRHFGRRHDFVRR